MVSDLLNSNMQPAFSDNNQVRVVTTFSELVNTTFHGEINAICWNRDLLGDFKEIVSKLELKENITEVSTADLLALQLSEKGILARDIMNRTGFVGDFFI